MTLISRLIWEDQGQNLVEYALLAGLVALVAVAAIEGSGTKLKDIYEAIEEKLKDIKV
jgi:Flp pilus assembly pilin Flp